MGTSALGHKVQISTLTQEVGIPQSKTSWNQFDEHGLVVGVSRIRGESNARYRRRLIDSFIHVSNSSYRGLLHAITRELGLSLFQPIQINPKTDSSGKFLAADPYIKFSEAYLYLYSDHGNNLLDYKIDIHEPGGNYEHLHSLVSVINSTSFFEASLVSGFDPYIKSTTIVSQSNKRLTPTESVPSSTRFTLRNSHIVPGSFISNNPDIFKREVSSESNILNAGDYFLSYRTGLATTYTMPQVGTAVRYHYISLPFLPVCSPVILHNINSEDFRVKMFNQVTQDDASMLHGLPTELGVDIINELLSVTPLYWGI